MKWNKVTVFPFVWLFFSLYDMDQKTKLLESSKLSTPAHDRITREVQKLCFAIHHKRLHCMRADEIDTILFDLRFRPGSNLLLHYNIVKVGCAHAF